MQVLFKISLFLSLFTGYSFSQIPLNGFCKFDYLNTSPGLKGILPVNYNNDSYSDLFLYGADDKTVFLYKGQVNSGFAAERKIKLHYAISQVKLLSDKAGQENLYAFISRTDRVAGLLKFNRAGQISIIAETKLGSYPENLAVADVNRDGMNDMLVSGGGYEGMSLFIFSKGALSEFRMFPRQCFSFAVFADLNNDTYADIAAFDIFSTSLKFFYNNSAGDFYEVRRFKQQGKIGCLTAGDFNLDGYQDLIFTQNNKITFLSGDNRAAFNNVFSVKTKNYISKLSVGDFNRDGMLDIACIDRQNCSASLLFAADQTSFHPEITYFSRKGLYDISPFYSKYIRGLVTISTSGEVNMISEVDGIRDDLKITLSPDPGKIFSFGDISTQLSGFCFYEKSSPSIKIVVRNSAGIPSRLYTASLVDSCSELRSISAGKNKMMFYCFTRGKRLIEILTLNLQKKSLEREKLYCPDPIEDLSVRLQENDEKPGLFILSRFNEELKFYYYKYSSFRYVSTKSGSTISNVLGARIADLNPVSVFFSRKEKKGVSFNKILVNSDLNFQNTRIKYLLSLKNNSEVFNFVGDIQNNNKYESVNFVLGGNNPLALISSGTGYTRLALKGSLQEISLSSENQLYCAENMMRGLNYLFIYNNSKNTLDKIDLINNQKSLIGKKMIEVKNLQSYFVKSMSINKNHLVFTDREDKCIKIKELSF